MSANPLLNILVCYKAKDAYFKDLILVIFELREYTNSLNTKSLLAVMASQARLSEIS